MAKAKFFKVGYTDCESRKFESHTVFTQRLNTIFGWVKTGQITDLIITPLTEQQARKALNNEFKYERVH